MTSQALSLGGKRLVKELYEGDSHRAVRFRYGMLGFDLATIAFIIASSFTSHPMAVELVDVLIGVVIVADVSARLWIASDRLAMLAHPLGLADVAVIVSLLAPVVGEGVSFLRVARMLRLLRSYQTVRRLQLDFAFFRRHQQTIDAVINLFVFLFVMTAIVYATQHSHNDKIHNYVDALYFTVTTLTTTGFGDVTLEGTSGRLIAVVIMISGVSLFLRLVQVMFRPAKREFRCPNCGLERHDYDAIHCKACGAILNVPNEGID